MIKNINDLSLFLSALGTFQKTGGISKKRLFFLIREKPTTIQWEVQTHELLKLGIKLNIFKMNDDRVILTEHGRSVLGMQTSDYTLNETQQRYMVENCIFNNPNVSDLLEFLSLFVFDLQDKTMICNSSDYPLTKIGLEILVQIGLVSKHGQVWRLNPNYIEFIHEIQQSRSIGQGRPISQEELKQILVEQADIGMYGEEISVIYEKQRLTKKSLDRESYNVKQVSIYNTNLGYDIASFNGKSPSLVYDRFIEVKARKRRVYSFIMSANEIRVAKEKGTKYVIYFWNGLGHQTPSTPVRTIVDPVNTLHIKECENCLSYIVYLDKHNYQKG